MALGFGAIAAESIAVFTVLKLVGAAYLIYLGIQTYRSRGQLVAALGPTGRRRPAAVLAGHASSG